MHTFTHVGARSEYWCFEVTQAEGLGRFDAAASKNVHKHFQKQMRCTNKGLLKLTHQDRSFFAFSHAWLHCTATPESFISMCTPHLHSQSVNSSSILLAMTFSVPADSLCLEMCCVKSSSAELVVTDFFLVCLLHILKTMQKIKSHTHKDGKPNLFPRKAPAVF